MSPCKQYERIKTMVVVQASKLSFTNPSLSSTTSLQFDAHSLSLALIHSDSSISLYPSLSPLSLTSFPSPSPQTLISPPSSSSSFLCLQSSSSAPRVLFIVAGPHRGGSQILLRFYIVNERKSLFSRAQVVCTQKGVSFEPRLGVLLDLNHGLSVKLAGGINYFALCLNSSSKVLVFGVKMVGGDENSVKLIRCAVIEGCTHVWSMSVSFGSLILGEDNGVRVFNLRALAKGKANKVKCSISNMSENHCLNGRQDEGRGLRSPNGSSEVPCNGSSDGKINKRSPSKQQLVQKSMEFPQNSTEVGACFVTFTRKEVGNLQSTRSSVKAVSVQALSSKKFIILDSTGDLHVLCLANPALGSNLNCHMRQLPHVVKVQKLATLPDISLRTPIIWVSDLYHSVHVLSVSDIGPAVHKNDASKCEEKLMQISVIQAIFAGEKIEDVVPLAANGILLLGQDNLYVYAIA